MDKRYTEIFADEEEQFEVEQLLLPASNDVLKRFVQFVLNKVDPSKWPREWQVEFVVDMTHFAAQYEDKYGVKIFENGSKSISDHTFTNKELYVLYMIIENYDNPVPIGMEGLLERIKEASEQNPKKSQKTIVDEIFKKCVEVDVLEFAKSDWM